MNDFEIKFAIIRIIVGFFVGAAMRYLTWGMLHEKMDETLRKKHSTITGVGAAIVIVVLSLIGG